MCKIHRAPCGIAKEGEQLSFVGASTSTQVKLLAVQFIVLCLRTLEDEPYNSESVQVHSDADEEHQPKESSWSESVTGNEIEGDVLPTALSSFQVKAGHRIRGVLCGSNEVF